MFSPVNISAGYQPSLDAASEHTSYLINWRLDAVGTNIPRPPLVSYSLTGMNAGTHPIGLYSFKDYLIIVGSDRYIYYVESANPTLAISLSTVSAGTQLAGASRPVFAEDASDVFIVGGGPRTKWTPGWPTAQVVSSAAGPPNITHIAWLGQRLIANNRATDLEKSYYYWSDAGDGSDATWNTSSFASPESDPDQILALHVNADWLWIFGPRSIQTFGVGSDATNPYDPVATVRVGLGAIDSPVRVDGSFAFIDETGRVILSDGRTQIPRDIGKDIVSEIQGMTTFTDAWGWRARHHSYDALGFSFPTAHRTFVYDLDFKRWSEESYYDQSQGLLQNMPVSCYAYWSRTRLHVFGRSDTNDVATLSDSTGLELGGALMCQRTISNVGHASAGRKASRNVRVYFKRGTSAASVPGMLEMRVRNDGKAWSAWKQRTVGIAGDAVQKQDFYFGGIFWKRDYDVRYAGSDATSIVSIQDDIVGADG